MLVAAGPHRASRICYYPSLKDGNAARVVPLDHLSLVFAVVMSAVFLGEWVSAQVAAGR